MRRQLSCGAVAPASQQHAGGSSVGVRWQSPSGRCRERGCGAAGRRLPAWGATAAADSRRTRDGGAGGDPTAGAAAVGGRPDRRGKWRAEPRRRNLGRPGRRGHGRGWSPIAGAGGTTLPTRVCSKRWSRATLRHGGAGSHVMRAGCSAPTRRGRLLAMARPGPGEGRHGEMPAVRSWPSVDSGDAIACWRQSVTGTVGSGSAGMC